MIGYTNDTALVVEWLLRIGLALGVLYVLVVFGTRVVHRQWRRLEAERQAEGARRATVEPGDDRSPG